ncbi:MAG: helix-turn-helix transcriptional regulator [Terracidiphilus sp.]
MSGSEFRTWRKKAGKTQVDAARAVGVRQPFVCAVEKGLRPVTPALKNWMYSVCPQALTETSTPLASASGHRHWQSAIDREAAPYSEVLKELLGNLGYPGFAYLARRPRKVDPLLVLLDALNTEDLDQRVTEALPWVLAHQLDLDWKKLTDEVRLRNLQNRLGFLLEVTVEATRKLHLNDVTVKLEPWLNWLREARLYKEDTLCKKSLTQVERGRLHRSRPKAARFWRLLTDLNAKEVANVVKRTPA